MKRCESQVQDFACEVAAISGEKNSDFAVTLKMLDEKCRKCTPLTPLECITRCKTWKLKNELRILYKNIENPDFTKDLINTLKNETRLHILVTIAKGEYSVHKLQQELRKTGYVHSQENIVDEYLHPLLEVGLALESQDRYHTTTFGNRLTEIIESSENTVCLLPPHSDCYEETLLKALRSGPKTFEEIKGFFSLRITSRILRRLENVGLVETPKERAYIFFFRSKRDPANEKFSPSEGRVYENITNEGVSAQQLAEKTGFAMRTIYKRVKALKGKKLVFVRKTPKTYCLTAKGEKLASVLDALYSLAEETLCSSEQVFKDNQNIFPQASNLPVAPYSKLPSKLILPEEEKTKPMRRSQMEMYVDILEILACRGPLKLTVIMENADVDCSKLRDCLDFLTKQGLVEVKFVRKGKKIYAVTQLGVTVLKQFVEIKEVLPIIVETRASTIRENP